MLDKRCKVCNEKLKESKRVTINGRHYKSCPNCSVRNGEEHVYYADEEFGVTDKRKTSTNPDGIQSYCTVCRGNAINNGSHILCSEIY